MNFIVTGTTAQQPFQNLHLLPEEAQQWLTVGATNWLDRSGGLDSSLSTDTSLSSLRRPYPLFSIYEDSSSGMDRGPLLPLSPNSHTHTHTQKHALHEHTLTAHMNEHTEDICINILSRLNSNANICARRCDGHRQHFTLLSNDIQMVIFRLLTVFTRAADQIMYV